MAHAQTNNLIKLNFIDKRKQYFQQLLGLKYDFSVWSETEKWQSWLPISVLDFNELVAKTSLHREILPNEWVFDIDGDDWQNVRELAVSLEDLFKKYDIVFNRWSSGHWLHYHVFTDDSKIVQTEPSWYKNLIKYHFHKLLKKNKISISELASFHKEVHKAIPLVLLEELKQSDNAYIDLQKFSTSRCLIRAEGSLNLKTKAYKTHLEELPQDQPLVKASWHVVFPEEIKIWKPDVKFYDNLFLTAYFDYVKPKYQLPKSKNYPPQTASKIEWIEKLLNTPLEDGRHRAVNLVLAPYFTNILKTDEQTALAEIMQWIQKCNELNPTKINQNYILYQLRYARKCKTNPLKRESLKRFFSNVPKILEISGLVYSGL